MAEGSGKTETKRFLIVSHRPEGRVLADRLAGGDHQTRHLDSLDDFEDVVAAWEPAVIAVDEEIPELRSREWIRRAKLTASPVCILLVNSYEPRSLALTVEMGAEAFFPRDAVFDDFLRVVEQELRAKEGSGDPENRIELSKMIGDSPQAREICRMVAVIAPSRATVLITGESGTGKELVARSIHRFSPRRDRPFVAINCGAIPEELVENELFGHLKDAYTGATSKRKGRFEAADGGTLFLDEVGELSSAVQVKLLRVLQERCFAPLGGVEPVEVDVRLIAATNVDLKPAVDEGRFRSDLFYRLNVLHLALPPLRDRTGDIQPLWKHFVNTCSADEGRTKMETDPQVVQMLARHDWPGNVRELENVARHSVTMRSREITPGGLPAYFHRSLDEPDGKKGKQRINGVPPTDSMRIPGMSLTELERIAIIRTVQSTGSIKEAASILEVSERTLYYRLKKYRAQGFVIDEA